jgi:hypothetical protein
MDRSVNPYQSPATPPFTVAARRGAVRSRGFWSISIASIAGGVCFAVAGIAAVFLLERAFVSLGPLIAVSAAVGGLLGLGVALMTWEGTVQLGSHFSDRTVFPTDWPASVLFVLLWTPIGVALGCLVAFVSVHFLEWLITVPGKSPQMLSLVLGASSCYALLLRAGLREKRPYPADGKR